MIELANNNYVIFFFFFLFFLHLSVIVSPENSVTIEPSFLIAEYGSSPSLTCATMAGPDNTFYWYYNISGTVCSEDCAGTVESFNDFLSSKNYNVLLVCVSNLYQ